MLAQLGGRGFQEERGDLSSADIIHSAHSEAFEKLLEQDLSLDSADLAAVDGATGKVLAYCRSGTRSINTWAQGEAARGGSPADIIKRGAAAGYDLSWLGA